jgi:hypothetical protein
MITGTKLDISIYEQAFTIVKVVFGGLSPRIIINFLVEEGWAALM